MDRVCVLWVEDKLYLLILDYNRLFFPAHFPLVEIRILSSEPWVHERMELTYNMEADIAARGE
jgi:hypothetical protein